MEKKKSLLTGENLEQDQARTRGKLMPMVKEEGKKEMVPKGRAGSKAHLSQMQMH